MNSLTKNDTVSLGSKVLVEIEEQKFTYKIVEPSLIDIENNDISSESPIGKGLIGRKEGELVEIQLPEADIVKCRILKIK